MSEVRMQKRVVLGIKAQMLIYFSSVILVFAIMMLCSQ